MILLAFACAPDLADRIVWDDGEPTPPLDTGSGPPTSVDVSPDGAGWRATVDARDPELWVALDLDVPSGVLPETPGWDLRFSRFDISANGGITGDGGVEAVFLPEGDELAVPTQGWISDAPDGEDDGDTPDYAMSTWYAYDSETHVLTPHPGTWLVRSTGGAIFPLQIVRYYDDAGSSAVFELTWGEPL